MSYFREITNTDRNGTNLYGLSKAAESIGLFSEALSGTIENLMDGIKNNSIHFPFIAHTLSDTGMLHFVVVISYKNNCFLIGDPDKGKRKIDVNAFSEIWTGYILNLYPTDNFKKGNYQRREISKFLLLLNGQRRKLLGVLIISIIISGIGIAGAFVFEIAIDHFATSSGYYEEDEESHEHDEENTTTNNSTAQNVVIKTLDYLLKELGDFSELSNFNLVFSSLIALYLLFSYYSVYSRVALLMVFFDSLIVLVFRRPIQRSNRQVMERNAQLQSYLKESIDGIETVKSSNASEKIKQKTTEIFNFLINSVVKNNLITMTQNTIADIVELIGTVIILWIGFYLVIIKQISIGSLITFYALLGYFSKPIKNVIELQPTIQSALVAIDRLNDILDLNLEQDSNNNTIPFPHVNKWICNNLYFRYGNRELTLQNVCLTIKNGEKIAIIGESGSGKTTLAKLYIKISFILDLRDGPTGRLIPFQFNDYYSAFICTVS